MMTKCFRSITGVLLAFVMILGVLPISMLTARAGHTCGDCNEWIDGSPYCSECYECAECCDLCIQCGVCTECSGSDICEGCSNEDIGDTICIECALDKGQHCSNCDECYFTTHSWCEECGKCESCTEMCDACSVNLGHGLLCVECAAEGEGHCPTCGGCYFEIGDWCEECLSCTNCIPICVYCTSEEGVRLCVECAISAGMHCPECDECYGEVNGDYCEQCGICLNCADICPDHELCIDCAIEDGAHCQSCNSCGNDATICEDCQEVCSECAGEMCENCGLCDVCVDICPECGACSNCAEICQVCGEYCSNCEGICDDCGLCLVCCEDYANFEGCDCGDWVCIENDGWQEHFDENHTESEGGHSARPASALSWSNTHHWHDCVYCDETTHRTGFGSHSYDNYNTCTVCGYIKDSRIMILEQPVDINNVLVSSPDDHPTEKNVAHFSVKAVGESKLTYTWCRKTYDGNKFVCTPDGFYHPEGYEDIHSPDLYIIAPEDSCVNDYYLVCIITDEAGNEVRTREVTLSARHNYQYYKYASSKENPYPYAERSEHGHVLQCVGNMCGKVSNLRGHEDDDKNKVCDICDYKITGILITKQPKDVKNVYVSSPDEDYTESSIAHFSVEAESERPLTYTWCRKVHNGKGWVYKEGDFIFPNGTEDYHSPDLYIVAPEDACVYEYWLCCFITDDRGNEIKTVEVSLSAKHNYQYFKEYLSNENPYSGTISRFNGHVLRCVSPVCGKFTRLRKHVDEENDYHCDLCNYRTPIFEVSIHVTPPVEGQKPDYNVSCDSPAYKPMGGSSNYGQYRFWLVSDNGVDNWKIMDKNSTFVPGKYYKFTVDLYATDDNEFATYNYTEPNYAPYVNGNYVYGAGKKTYNKDALTFTTIEYVFGECNDSVIERIVIDGVTEPVAGKKPSYNATVRGSGYNIKTDHTRYENDYQSWNIPENERRYYIVNGIGWFDETASDWLYSDETFIPGHRYNVNVYLETEDGYTFYVDKYWSPLFDATVNGYSATSINGNNIEQTVVTPFNCTPMDINTVMLYGLDAPRAGETPDYSMTTAYPEFYTLDENYAGSNGIVWYDAEGNMLEPTDTFVEGETYKVEIKVIPAKLEGASVCQFTKPIAAYIDGKQITAGGDWDMVYISTGAVYIYYTFPESALPPANRFSVSGEITSQGSETAEITVQLIKSGLKTPSYESIVTGNKTSFRFGKVSSGAYTLRIIKEDHEVWEKSITVDSSVIQHAILTYNGEPPTQYLPGDVSCDGEIDKFDYVFVKRTVMGTLKLDELQKLTADVNKDGSIDKFDYILIKRHVMGSYVIKNG